MIETQRFELAWSWPLVSGGAGAPGLGQRRALLTAPTRGVGGSTGMLVPHLDLEQGFRLT